VVFLSIFAKSMSFGLLYIYVETVLDIGEGLAPALASAMLVGLMALPLWTWLAPRIRRKWCLVAGLAIMAVTLLGIAALKPGPDAGWQLSLLVAVHYLGFPTIGLFSAPFI